ncbi:MAG: cupin domain-containing protein [Myxococcaceae bacterium]|jgi:mannose-6-phosphate isomerase-like protein (cupin superfamily)|nr:cupin domain-containing protein [Myxococcaceae bacterium]
MQRRATRAALERVAGTPAIPAGVSFEGEHPMKTHAQPAEQPETNPAAPRLPSHHLGALFDLEERTLTNLDFRRVLHTARHVQLVLMSIPPGEQLGEEVHEVDQFFRFEEGTGTIVVNGAAREVYDGMAAVIPAGVRHNVINGGKTPLKLYTLYAPPQHADGLVQRTRADAQAAEARGNGSTTTVV